MSTGRFVWFDLMTSDLPAASAFYAGLFGWDIRPHGGDYHMIHVGEESIGGMMPAQGPAPSHWLAYVTTDDLADTLARVEKNGGRVYHRQTIETLGEFAVIADRQGGVLSPIQFKQEPEKKSVAKAANYISWAELHTTDPDDALKFYQALFGWASQTWNGDYHLVGDHHDAGIMKGQPGVPPHWLLYVNVEDADATVAKAQSLGARVHVPPQDIPGVGRFSVFADPTGAVIAVMQSARRD